MLETQSAAAGHRDRPAADLPGPHLQDGADVPRQPGRRGRSRYAKKKCAGHAEPQDARLVDDDRVRAVAAGVRRHPRQGVPSSAPSTSGRRAAATSTAWRWRTSRNPLIGRASTSLSMLVVGSHLWHGVSSAFQSLGLDHPRWTPRILRRRQGARGRSSPAASSSSRSGRTSSRGRCTHDAGRARSRPARSPRSGTGTSSR